MKSQGPKTQCPTCSRWMWYTPHDGIIWSAEEPKQDGPVKSELCGECYNNKVKDLTKDIKINRIKLS